MKGTIKEISYDTATRFLLPRHYSGRCHTISKAFGWYDNNTLKAVCTFGKPASPQLCDGVCGKEYSSNVYELNRLCRVDNWKEPLSMFVSYCLRQLKPLNLIIISYSDTAMNHHGYIYQACNFIYTGKTKERTDKYVANGRHSRHYTNEEQTGFRKVRSAKHRYIYFCTNNKHLKKKWLNALNYPIIKQYPKGDNSPDYTLGNFLQDKLVVDTTVHDFTIENKKNKTYKLF